MSDSLPHKDQNFSKLGYKEIPTKKNNKKPVPRKSKVVNQPATDNLETLVNALREEKVNETSENKVQERDKAKYHKNDRSKMWQKETNVAPLQQKRRSRKTLEDRWTKPREKGTIKAYKYLWVIGVIIGLVSIIGFWTLFRSITDQKKSEIHITAQNVIESNEIKKSTLDIHLQEVSEIINQYLLAATIEEKSQYIYRYEDFKTHIDSFYEKVDLEPESDFSLKTIQPLILNSQEYWKASVNHASGEKSSYYLRKNDQGSWLVDWKSGVVFQENDINSFIVSKSNEPQLFRCYLEIGNHLVYNWEFTDENYYSVKIVMPDSDQYLWGYIEKESKVSDKISELRKEAIINHGIKDTLNQFTIRIKFLEGTAIENSQYVLIDDVISNSWLNTEE